MIDVLLMIFAPKLGMKRKLIEWHAQLTKAYEEHKELEHTLAAYAMRSQGHPFAADNILTIEFLRQQNEDQLRQAMKEFNEGMEMYAKLMAT